MQLQMETIEQAAPDLAVLLRWREESAGWGLVRLARWAIGRCNDALPPSACDVVHGPHAARLLARAAGYRGDPDSFVSACEQVHPEPVLQRVPGGVRVCGLARYDSYWAKSNPERWRDYKANPAAFVQQAAPAAKPPTLPAENQENQAPVRTEGVAEGQGRGGEGTNSGKSSAETVPETALLRHAVATARRRNRGETGAVPHRNRPGTGAKPVPHIQIQIQNNLPSEGAAPGAARPAAGHSGEENHPTPEQTRPETARETQPVRAVSEEVPGQFRPGTGADSETVPERIRGNSGAETPPDADAQEPLFTDEAVPIVPLGHETPGTYEDTGPPLPQGEAPKPKRKPRTKTTEELFRDWFQALRLDHLRTLNMPAVEESDWPYPRANKQLAFIRQFTGDELTEAVCLFFDDNGEGGPAHADVRWPLGWFVKKHSGYMERAIERLQAQKRAAT